MATLVDFDYEDFHFMEIQIVFDIDYEDFHFMEI